MKEGNFDICISSPPYSDCERGGTGVVKHSVDCKCNYCKKNKGNAGNIQGGKWGQSDNRNLGIMPEGSIDAVISSPPYEGDIVRKRNQPSDIARMNRKRIKCQPSLDQYGIGKDNLGNSSGDTFWSASRVILQQCFDLLKDGGEPVPDGEGIDFCEGHNE